MIIPDHQSIWFLQSFLNEIITGKSTGNVATIESIENYDGIFDIKFSNRISEGWENETGKLSEDFQVLAR